MDNVDNRGEGQLHACSWSCRRRWKGGFAVNVAYTLAHSDSNAPDTGNSSLGPVSSTRTTSRRTAARTRTS